MILPMMFREALASAGLRAIDEWWAHLDSSSRSEALHLWHECSQAESKLAVRVEARFADESDENAGDFWHSDYYDYLVNHEIYLLDVPDVHICTQHPVAAAAARTGFIPHDFACPLQAGDCPMRRLLALAPGRSLRLRVSVVADDRTPNRTLLANPAGALSLQSRHFERRVAGLPPLGVANYLS
jgi:hypothetical protein